MHIDTVLLKVASRCNLDCSYCYVYHMGDESWRTLPKRMAADTQALVAAELGALMRAQGRPFSIVLHGGEPLLLGLPRLEGLFAELRAQLGAACGISIQTNGVLISDAVLDLCLRFDVTLSVSLDGPPAVHDRFRVDLRQRATHGKVVAGLERLKAHTAAGRLFSGVLCVVDPTSDPEAVYDYFKALDVPSVDFLYRDGNHTTLPFGKASASSAEYGAWMCRILDRYVADPAPFRSRLLDDMMRLLLGGAGVKEGVGLTDYGILVIDTDGAVKKNDTLKSSPLGDTFDVTWVLGRQALADIAASPEFKAYHLAQRPSSPTCYACPHLRVCGGGMVTHRFKEGAGYDNPTVFCADQMLLIARMEALLAPYLKDRAA
ncbi:cyclophane-forming radical SAM/SPASM peptide maturase YhhB [Phenylobacterium sp.]|uniref:cyclophane-forming radical SAM/SPASM peptide maturase YhhB n=1 Tax=Phenylobacterium sp. TaxID=1871053 RepID=UPI00356A5990